MEKFLDFPIHDDVKGAANAIDRLQYVYELNISKLANGDLLGMKHRTILTLSDFYKLGQLSLKNFNFHHCFLWMREAEVKYKPNSGVDMDYILAHEEACIKANTSVSFSNTKYLFFFNVYILGRLYFIRRLLGLP